MAGDKLFLTTFLINPSPTIVLLIKSNEGATFASAFETFFISFEMFRDQSLAFMFFRRMS